MINIAIDGPCGAGKSTISKILAHSLKFAYLDTGAMYRATALYFHENSLNFYEMPQSQVEKVLLNVKISIEYDEINKTSIILLNKCDVSNKIREHFVSKLASDISKIPAVRLFLVEMQRQIASQGNVVLDGRDIGSYVLPNAQIKFYLTATAEERARRRHLELINKGEVVDYNRVLEDINDRDYNDMNRSFAPLKQCDDAVLIDSTNLNQQEVVEEMMVYIKKKGLKIGK